MKSDRRTDRTWRVTVLPVIDSTNQYLLDSLNELQSGDACVAEYQQAGAAGASGFALWRNLYLSMYWRLEQACCGWIESGHWDCHCRSAAELGADKVRVKWPNDLYLQDRKLSGSGTDGENRRCCADSQRRGYQPCDASRGV
jgi:BirA family biotin operon repressor/biotin-[acetyl-CoA-carboxylase] ligase